MKKIIYILLILVPCISCAEIYVANPQKSPHEIMDGFAGYCRSPSEEMTLWLEVARFSNSALAEIPEIPSDQKNYIEGELRAFDNERNKAIRGDPMYKMVEIYGAIEKFKIFSAYYIKHKKIITLAKKVELLALALQEAILVTDIAKDTQNLTKELRAKGYRITEDQLSAIVIQMIVIKDPLLNTLICYGKNNINK